MLDIGRSQEFFRPYLPVRVVEEGAQRTRVTVPLAFN